MKEPVDVPEDVPEEPPVGEVVNDGPCGVGGGGMRFDGDTVPVPHNSHRSWLAQLPKLG